MRLLIEPLQEEESLTVFLRSYSKETEVLSAESARQFVAELHERWMAAQGGDAEEAGSWEEKSPPQGAMFFISYSRKTDPFGASCESLVSVFCFPAQTRTYRK